MRISCLVNAVNISPYALMPVCKSETAFGKVLAYVGAVPGIEKMTVLCNPEAELPTLPPGAERQTLRGELLDAMIRAAEGFDALLYVYGDCPMLDTALTERMLENHKRYFAEYTFADGYPYGLAPEILKPGILPLLKKLAGIEEGGEKPKNGVGRKPISRDYLFTLIQKDINAFDIETELSPKDMRLLRINLCCDNRRNYEMVRSVMGFRFASVAELLTRIEERQEALRTLPKFFNIQVAEGCAQACAYCPYPVFGGDILTKRGYMEPGDFSLILDQIETLAEDAVISLSLWGEPALHPRLPELVSSVLSRNNFKLIIETSGLNLPLSVIKSVHGSLENVKDFDDGRLTWIVSLDAVTADMYKTLRGDGFEEAAACAENLLSVFPDDVYVQAVRMKDNEDSLEQFFRDWKKKTEHVIIQKYDWFCGFEQQKKVTDLSPVVRFPCWHLKRDMNILLDGAVPLCREDVKGEYPIGNVWTDGLEAIWQRMGEFYLKHLRKDYPGLCERCDEYYTYNF